MPRTTTPISYLGAAAKAAKLLEEENGSRAAKAESDYTLALVDLLSELYEFSHDTIRQDLNMVKDPNF